LSVGKKTALLFFLALAEVLAKKTNVLFERWRFQHKF
jgi:hypothetical protein